MRVAILTESFPPGVNGVAHCVLRVAELLTSYGHHPLVIAPRPPGARKEGTSFPFPVVRVPAAPLPGYPSFRLGLPSRRVRAALVQHRAEVMHLASPVFLGAHGAAVASRLGLPTVTATGLLGQGIGNVWLWGRGVDTRRFDPARRSQELRSRLAPGGELIAGYADLAALLASADAVIAPGPAETFGLTALEALACGTPVVVSAESALPEIAGEAGASVPGEDLAAGVLAVLARPERARRAAARARAERYDWSTTVRGFLAVHGASQDRASPEGRVEIARWPA